MSNSDESDQDFYLARSHKTNEDPVTKDGSTNADPAAPLMRTSSANEWSHVLTEEENQLINEKIDRLVAVLQAGRQLHFSPDHQTGNFNVSIAHDRSDLDDRRSNVEAAIVASPEDFGDMTRTGGGRRRVLSPNSALFDSTKSSKVVSSFSSSAWEDALAPDDGRSTLEHGSGAQIPPLVRRNIPSEIRGAIRRDGQYITYVDKNDVKVAAVAPVPLDFNSVPRKSTPSIHSTGSDLDCSSPLFEKSLQALMRETSQDLSRSQEASHGSRSSGIRDSVSDWLERLEITPIVSEDTDAVRKQQDFNVFHDGGKHEIEVKRHRKPLTAGEALKDVSNLRHPGYLLHNSFAQTSQVSKSRGDPAHPRESGSQTQAFVGATDAESRRSSIEAIWPLLLSNHNSRKQERSTTRHQRSIDKTHSTSHICRRRRKYPSPQKSNLQDPNRTADFDLALARLEGHAPPQQYSPIRRYADETGLYGPDVLVERRQLRHHQPVPMRLPPFALSTAQRFEQAFAEGDDDGGGKRGGGSG